MPWMVVVVVSANLTLRTVKTVLANSRGKHGPQGRGTVRTREEEAHSVLV
jgi:hypothetical protein